MEKVKQRNNSMDLLRLLCMLMIVAIHYFTRGGVISQTEKPLNYYAAVALDKFCIVSVNCFYLITGYYLRQYPDISFRGIARDFLKTYGKVLFCSSGLTLLLILIGKEPFMARDIIESFFPILFNRYWFATVFVLVISLKPYLSKLVYSLSNRELTILLVSLGAFDVLQGCGVASYENGYGILHAIFVVILGYAINRNDRLRIEKMRAAFLYLASCVGSMVIALGARYVLPDTSLAITSIWYNSPLIIIASICLFNLFLSIEIKGNLFYRLAPYVFFIYLFNEHPQIKQFFYMDVLHCDHFYNSPLMLVHCIGSVLFFGIIGILIGVFYQDIVLKVCAYCYKRLSEKE